MPRRKPYRKNYRRKKRSYARKARLTRQPRSPIADSQVVKMRYGSRISINPGAGVAASHVFSANDIFDPDFTGVGHQPLGHDEWALFYNQYTVIGSKITAIFNTQSSAAADNVMCSIRLADASNVSADPERIIEGVGNVWTVISNMFGNSVSRPLRKGFSAKRFFQHNSVKDADDLRVSFGTSPGNPAFYILSCAASDGVSNPSNVSVSVQIDYVCLLTGRKFLASS